MNIVYLTSKDNRKIKHLHSLIEQSHYRKKHQQSIIEGTHLVLAYLEQVEQTPIEALFTTEQALQHADFKKIQLLYQGSIFVISKHLYQELSQLGTSIACLAIINLKHHHQNMMDLQYDIDSMILEDVQDPGNVGTLLRSAAAAGIKQVICTQGTANLWSPRVMRAGMGAHFSLKCFENIQLSDILKQFKIPILATSLNHSTTIYQQNLRYPVVWILGNEGQGVSETALNYAQPVHIPQPGGQESLNVAVAGSICLFEMVRQRLI